ncbi:MAG: hypothetical protein QM778_27865 [Myxococcales bacterium]
MSIHAWVLRFTPRLLVFLVLATGCGGASLRRVASPVSLDVPPQIEQAVDLGALPLPASGPLSTELGDRVFTPGEWVAVLGTGLARSDAQVRVGGRPLPIEGYLENGLLVRVPRGLPPRAKHTLEVQTARGHAAQPIHFASYVVVSDVSGNKLRFLRMSSEAKRLFEEPQDLPLTRVRKHVFSPDGGLIYAVQAHAAEHDGRYALAVVHAGAAEHPVQLTSVSLPLSGVPVDLVAAHSRRQLWLLTQRELVVLDVSDPLSPRESARVALPAGTPWSLAALEGDTRAAVLEREGNQLWFFDMTGAPPRLAWTFALPPEHTARASIALLADRADTQRLWVLQGRSLARLAGRADKLVDSIRSPIERAKEAIGLGAPQPEVEPQEAPSESEPAPPARVLGLILAGDAQPVIERELALPEAFVPLMLRAGVDGRLLVSGISSDAAKLQSVGDAPNLSNITAWLLGSVQFGRVVAVDPAQVRETETLAQGMAMFFDVDQLADGQLVYSVMRFGVHGLPPGIGVHWRIEAPHLDAVGIRKLSWTAVLPPYVSPPVGVQ